MHLDILKVLVLEFPTVTVPLCLNSFSKFSPAKSTLLSCLLVLEGKELDICPRTFLFLVRCKDDRVIVYIYSKDCRRNLNCL